MFTRKLRPAPTLSLAVAATALAILVVSPLVEALPPPPDRYAHGAAGTARNGFGGEVAPSATSESWPGTGLASNGGPFAFVGAQYGTLWSIPATPNNSRGVGYCVMEDVNGEGPVAQERDPEAWSANDQARAAALMATFGGDRVVPYGINDSGTYNTTTGEWEHPRLFGGGEFTRRRQIAVNFGVRMFLRDLSPSGVAGGRRLARDTHIANGSGGNFQALRNGYAVARYMAEVADQQHAVGGLRMELLWGTLDGQPPTSAGLHPLEVHVTDSTGKAVGLVPVLQLSTTGIDDNRSIGAIAHADNAADTSDDNARLAAAATAGWPTWNMEGRLDADPRFAVSADPQTADVADARGVARFSVEIKGPEWELGFHTQSPTGNVDLYAGSGIQGQVTWSGAPKSVSVSQQFVPPDQYISVAKSSSDAAVPAAGSEFGLYDGSGDEIDRSVVGGDGRAPFRGFSPAAFEAPYLLRELSAAEGLERITTDIAIPSIPALSTDPAAPTLIEVVNTATTGSFGVRKLLDNAAVQSERDMSGFVFQITQVATGRDLGKLTTDSDGRTPHVEAVLGDYRITEVARPAWAEALIDPGPITHHFEPWSDDDEVEYTNLIPEVTISTQAADSLDGDKFVVLPSASFGDLTSATAVVSDTVVDIVSYCGVVPGTEYAVKGEIQVLAKGHEPEPSGVRGQTIFNPDAPCGTVEVTFEVPPDSLLRGHVGVVFEEVVFVDSGVVVAEHADPTDLAQSIYFPAIETNMHLDSAESPEGLASRLIDVGSPIVDLVQYAGLLPGERYRAELILQQRRRDGDCIATAGITSTEFTATDSSGTVAVGGLTVTEPGVYVGYERIYLVGGSESQPDPVVAIHEDCSDLEQTLWAPGMTTAAASKAAAEPGEMTDLIHVLGLSEGLPQGATAIVRGALHNHQGPDREAWVCDTANQVASYEIAVEHDGTVVSPGEPHDLGWYSYSNQVVVTFEDGSTWESAHHGCALENESFLAAVPPSPATTSVPTVASSPPPTSDRPTSLPVSGNGDSGRLQLLAVLLILGGGSLTLFTPARPLHRRESRLHTWYVRLSARRYRT